MLNPTAREVQEALAAGREAEREGERPEEAEPDQPDENDAGPPMERREEAQVQGGLPPERATGIAEARRQPDAPDLDDALAWRQRNARERALIAAADLFWIEESKPRDSIRPGEGGEFRLSRDLSRDWIQELAKVAADEQTEASNIKRDADLSPAGKTKRLERLPAKYAERRQKAHGSLRLALEALQARDNADARRWAERKAATPRAAPTPDERLLRAIEVNTLFAGANVGRSDDRGVQLIAHLVDYDEVLARAALERFALIARDGLKVQLAAVALRKRTEARRAHLLSDKAALATLTAVAEVRRVRGELERLRSFLEEHPTEADLAMQRLDAIFRELE